MTNQFNSTGEFGINRYGPASGPQHIASAPTQQGGKRNSQRQNRRSLRNKSQRGGKRSDKRRRNEKRRRSNKRQRGGK